MNSKDLLHRILSDMRVEHTEEFDKNFERKAFITDKWKKRATNNTITKNTNSKISCRCSLTKLLIMFCQSFINFALLANK